MIKNIAYDRIYGGVSAYRFITDALDANSYPVEDGFYLEFDGTTLNQKITER